MYYYQLVIEPTGIDVKAEVGLISGWRGPLKGDGIAGALPGLMSRIFPREQDIEDVMASTKEKAIQQLDEVISALQQQRKNIQRLELPEDTLKWLRLDEERYKVLWEDDTLDWQYYRITPDELQDCERIT